MVRQNPTGNWLLGYNSVRLLIRKLVSQKPALDTIAEYFQVWKQLTKFEWRNSGARFKHFTTSSAEPDL